jgi:hypothetical protein
MYPQTPLGKLAGAVVILVGVLVRTFQTKNKIDKILSKFPTFQYAISHRRLNDMISNLY